jgi:hypothetical protein
MCPLLLHFGGKNGLFSLNQANRVKRFIFKNRRKKYPAWFGSTLYIK